MASGRSTLLQHPFHGDHPLEYEEFVNLSTDPVCYLCDMEISEEGYCCQEDSTFYYYHKLCAEAPTRIDHHPLHPDHPITLLRYGPLTRFSSCNFCCRSYGTKPMFKCQECNFNLDIRCALSTLSDLGGTIPKRIDLPFHPHPLISFTTGHHFIRDGHCVICKEFVEGDGYMCSVDECQFVNHKRCIRDLFGDEYELNLDISCDSSTLLDQTPKWIALSLHNHLLTSFSTRYDFVKASDCVICKTSVEGEGEREGYVCLHWKCEFRIHKRCFQDLYCADGTKVPRVYHGHQLETYLGKGTCSRMCVKCGSFQSLGEFIDPLVSSGYTADILRCIQVGLLCVQENPTNRPTMASISLMLNSHSVPLPVPTQPAFLMNSSYASKISTTFNSTSQASKGDKSGTYSVNEVSVTEPYPR